MISAYPGGQLVAYQQHSLPPDHKDYAQQELIRARALLDMGNCLDADASLSNACEVMEQIAGDEDRERQAVLWRESRKTFKGRPHERALAWFYRGICRYQMEDYVGALACFRHSLACDQETISDKQEHLEDFTISHFMAARTYSRLGEVSNAEAALAAARRYAPDAPYLSGDSLQANAVIIIETGTGPFLRHSALGESIVRVDCRKSPDAQVHVLVDGQHVGKAATITDLVAQAKSQGWGEMDRLRLGKGIGKRVLSSVPLVGYAAMLVNPEADTRCWANVPRFFHVYTGNVSPGLHSISIELRDDKDEPQHRYGQVWHHIRFSSGRETFLMLRSVRNAQNHHYLVPAELSAETARATPALGQLPH